MSGLKQLLSGPPFEQYDEGRFFRALTESLERWKQNDLYRRKLERSEVDGPVTSWGDVHQLPTIGMREFKQHPEELAIDELNPDQALYSSGTTSESKSFAARSTKTLEIHQGNLASFSRAIIGDVDYAAALGVPRGDLARLPADVSRRALFRYLLWLMEPHDASFFLRVSGNKEIEPEYDRLYEYLDQHSGKGVLKGSTSGIAAFCNYLEEQDASLDLGEDGMVITGGGWKGQSEMTRDELRTLIARQFGIQEENQLDFYSATEFTFFTGSKPGDDNPSLKRVPAQAYCYIADIETFRTQGVVEPVANGEEGLLVVVDPLNRSHPGVILTDDVMRKIGGEYGQDVRIDHMGRSTRI